MKTPTKMPKKTFEEAEDRDEGLIAAFNRNWAGFNGDFKMMQVVVHSNFKDPEKAKLFIENIERMFKSVEEETRKEERKKVLCEYLMPANELLRSAYQVATRKGRSTNWIGLQTQIGKELDRQHTVLKPIRISKLESKE